MQYLPCPHGQHKHPETFKTCSQRLIPFFQTDTDEIFCSNTDSKSTGVTDQSATQQHSDVTDVKSMLLSVVVIHSHSIPMSNLKQFNTNKTAETTSHSTTKIRFRFNIFASSPSPTLGTTGSDTVS